MIPAKRYHRTKEFRTLSDLLLLLFTPARKKREQQIAKQPKVILLIIRFAYKKNYDKQKIMWKIFMELKTYARQSCRDAATN